jgi:hypothetical protein
MSRGSTRAYDARTWVERGLQCAHARAHTDTHTLQSHMHKCAHICACRSQPAVGRWPCWPQPRGTRCRRRWGRRWRASGRAPASQGGPAAPGNVSQGHAAGCAGSGATHAPRWDGTGGRRAREGGRLGRTRVTAACLPVPHAMIRYQASYPVVMCSPGGFGGCMPGGGACTSKCVAAAAASSAARRAHVCRGLHAQHVRCRCRRSF